MSEWEPDNPSERELERARQYEEEQRRKAAGLDDEYFEEERDQGVRWRAQRRCLGERKSSWQDGRFDGG